MSTTSIYPMGTVIGDALPGSPVLAQRGSITAGVTTLTVTRPSVSDFSGGLADPLPTGPRELIVEAWYPALPGEAAPAEYTDYMGRKDLSNLTPFTFPGRACRDAAADASLGACPVVIISHGYPGSRMLLSNLAENLSSKGYVVLSIGHTDNTYPDFIAEASFESALVHRTMDQRAVLDALPELNAQSPLAGIMDLSRIALVGFSMGGYGVLRTIGAKAGEKVHKDWPSISSLVSEPDWQGDPRVKAAAVYAPATFLIDTESLANIRIPTLWVCGTKDPTVGYEAVKSAYEKTVNSRRALISYIGLGHNVANNPAPQCALSADWTLLKRWADPVWDTWRLNTLNQHFLTAFLDSALLGGDGAKYYELPEGAALPGFVEETDVGVLAHHLPARD